ncbi:hypothetical protein Taro_030093 [Colocasia esculenta]|uniref:Uncharacterized protein n=1 Tax=Colocasia esculenta TaxID=4460 RepID=A0A843VWV9_COLES|nr:hypothetical protein [Colocasia esculenta]
MPHSSHEDWFTTPATDPDKPHRTTSQSYSHGRKVQLPLHLNKSRNHGDQPTPLLQTTLPQPDVQLYTRVRVSKKMTQNSTVHK